MRLPDQPAGGWKGIASPTRNPGSMPGGGRETWKPARERTYREFSQWATKNHCPRREKGSEKGVRNLLRSKKGSDAFFPFLTPSSPFLASRNTSVTH